MAEGYRGYQGGNTKTARYLYGYKKLLAWQAADDLAACVHEGTNQAPTRYRRLVEQMLASASSAKANIAEGYCRNSLGDYIRFCEIARGSLGELGSQIQDAERWGLLQGESLDKLLALFKDTTYLLEQLLKSLHRKRKDGDWNRDLNLRDASEPYFADRYTSELPELP